MTPTQQTSQGGKQDDTIGALLDFYKPQYIPRELPSCERWVRTAYYSILREVNFGIGFSETHRERFVNLFSPFFNPSHPIWKPAGGLDRTANWNDLQHLNNEAHAFAQLLSKATYMVKHNEQLLEREDPIRSIIEKKGSPALDAFVRIAELIDSGMDFTKTHYDLFLRRFDPHNTINHPLWVVGEEKNVTVNMDFLRLAHKVTAELADRLWKKMSDRDLLLTERDLKDHLAAFAAVSNGNTADVDTPRKSQSP